MALPQIVVLLVLLYWNCPAHAAAIALLLATQVVLMKRFLADPVARAIWYSALGVTLYVLGMLVAAFALRSINQGGVI
jgi:chlorophyll/bacteriochlorophyll a synthase